MFALVIMIQQTLNEDFEEWLTNHRDLTIIFTFLSMFNIEILYLLKLIFRAPFNRKTRRRLFIASFLFKDIPKMAILVS